MLDASFLLSFQLKMEVVCSSETSFSHINFIISSVLYLFLSPRHEDVWGSGCIDPRTIDIDIIYFFYLVL
jgi:hypothetical protein